MRLSAGVRSAARAALAAVIAGLTLATVAAPAGASSLYSGPGPRPGPAILYESAAIAPELTNTGIWHAPPILIPGTTAYRNGEFLYQDYLYDDHGAREVLDPTDPRASGDTFSKPNGTYTYPTGPGYNNDAADLVEFRVKPTATATAFRISLNTLENPSLIAFSIAIGGQPGQTYPFPDGANVVAPAGLFLTVHPSGSKLVADLVRAGSDTAVAGAAPTVSLDKYRRQIEVDVPHQDWNPGQSTVRMAMGVGLWNSATGKYLLPGPTATATQPGGAGIATNPAGFFNVAFRTAEPFPSETAETGAVLDAAWWRDQEQGTALAQGNISPFYANVSFAKLPSIVITPEGRGPDQEYEGVGAADVFEAWAEIASLYPLNPAYTDITGYSMGGIGTFKLGAQFPDLFARAQPTVGFETNNDVLGSLRNLPVLMWNVSSDELVNASDYAPTAAKLASLGYRYELDVYQPCANSLCSPVLANHLMLGINDQFAPAAAFLGSATVDPNPAHVTYVVDTARDRPSYGIVGDHAYWVSGLTLHSPSHTSTTGDPEGEIDVFSHGFGTADPIASGNEPGTGTLTGGNMGPLAFASLSQTWGAALPAPASDTLDVTATNIATASIDVSRAHVDCGVHVNVTTDGPITIDLPGCNRTIQAG